MDLARADGQAHVVESQRAPEPLRDTGDGQGRGTCALAINRSYDVP